MKQAAIAGALTGLGTFLACLAVYKGVRLDWPETMLVAGVAFLVGGLIGGARIIKEITDRCGEE